MEIDGTNIALPASDSQLDIDTGAENRILRRDSSKRSRVDSETETRRVQTKQIKLRPKRTRAQAEAELRESRKSLQIPSSTESPVENKRKTGQAFKDLVLSTEDEQKPRQPLRFHKNLVLSTGDELMDNLATLGEYTLAVDIARGSTIPERGTQGSAAYDITAAETVCIPARSTRTVALNLRLAIPEDHFLLLLSRSGLALKGITIEGGVIDADYRGEIKAIVRNSTEDPFTIKKKQRIVQGVFFKRLDATFQVRDIDGDASLHPGFGSTGD